VKGLSSTLWLKQTLTVLCVIARHISAEAIPRKEAKYHRSYERVHFAIIKLMPLNHLHLKNRSALVGSGPILPVQSSTGKKNKERRQNF